MDKFEYIRRQLSKANRKTLELYITSRIWNKIDRLDLEFITQQPVRGTNRYFTDIYFPQLKLHIEIDEKYHKHINQELKDKIRERDIISVTNHEIIRIDATESIEEIHERIDEITKIINEKIKYMGNNFKSWDGVYKDSSYYIKQGYMDSNENVVFKKTVDACNCFGHSYRGQQKGGVKHPIWDDYFIWFPKLFANDKWENNITDDDNIIYERPIKSEEEITNHIKNTIEDKRNKRLVFANIKDNLGMQGYRFMGVYSTDKEESLKMNCAVYKKIDNRVKTFEPINK